MNILSMYKQLSNEDKANLTIYSIYNSIFDAARNEDVELSDKDAIDIQELSYDIYLDDEYRNLSSSQIAFFITKCYVNDNTFLEKLEDIDYKDILQAVEDDDYDFL